jgi:Peptidase family M1 domain
LHMKRFTGLCILIGSFSSVLGQAKWGGKFEQMDQLLPTPNSYRSSSGAPGPSYWQQRADYDISVTLNDETQVITGSETITYYNNAPEALTYLWLQLDQNIEARGNMTQSTKTNSLRDSIPAKFLASTLGETGYPGGFTIKSVNDAKGNALPTLVNYTMMRIDLPAPLKTGEKFTFSVAWSYHILDRMVGGNNDRGGMEFFPGDKNYVYTIAQWFPRMCVFDDYEGWQNKQFLDDGEFTLTFGDYKVRITVPSDHIVGASGWLQNPGEVLAKEQLERFQRAQKTFDQQVWIVTAEEALRKEKEKSKKTSTWVYHAENVRDFAFASSRRFIWDAQAVKIGSRSVLAQSLYTKEASPLWPKESTKAVKNALEIYSLRSIEYPYRTAYSVNWVGGGMEYPMISFNGRRPKPDGTYDQRTLERMVAVIIHEVGHNFFPMIINSDERQSAWMDEGINSFLETETIKERYPGFDVTSNTPKGVTAFMKGDKSIRRPIMASADNQGADYGDNGYDKPAAALSLLRETVMGPELFDKAFKEYSTRWAFKHPKAADFFRTMEDASAVDLDWFWRGWFYSTDHVDVTVEDVKWFTVKGTTVDPEKKSVKVTRGDLTVSGGQKGTAADFSKGPQEITVMNTPETDYRDFKNRVDDNAIRVRLQGKHLYEITLRNTGGLVTPLLIEWTFKDGSKELERIPAEIWRMNETEVKKVFLKDKEVINIVIDPNQETGDVNTRDNVFPKKPAESKFEKLRKGVN